jgi:hypothetical protein
MTVWVTMRHRESLRYADIPEQAVEAHRGLGWVPLDEWPADEPETKPADEAPAATAEEAPAPKKTTRRGTAAEKPEE